MLRETTSTTGHGTVAAQASLALNVPLPHFDHVLGPASAAVTLLEYGDFECSRCKQACFAVKIMFAAFGRRIRFAYRHFPQTSVHPHGELAAEAAEAAGAQRKFWPMYHLLFENQSHLKLRHLRTYAQRLELDLGRFDFDLAEHVYLQRVREHVAAGEASEVRTAPAFFLDGVIQDVTFGFSRLYEAVRTRLAVPGGSNRRRGERPPTPRVRAKEGP